VRKLSLLLPAALLALALGLAACGGGGESDEDKIVATIEESATSRDPGVCKETQTTAFMEQTNEGSGAAAVKECEKETEEEGENDPESVEVSKVEVEGSSATADVKFEGGSLDGQTAEVALVEEGGNWKLDQLTGFAGFNAAQIVESVAEQLENNPGVKPQQANCIVEGLEEAPTEELENLVLENDTQPIVELAESCE
jgi:ABC-type glycerol-3-phosphate transport system substrate-binding protein